MQGKPLAELRTEIDLGLRVYASTNPDVRIFRVEGQYVFFHFDEKNGGTAREHPITEEDMHREEEKYPVWNLPTGYDGQPGAFRAKAHAPVYATFEDLLADWPVLTAKSVWSTRGAEEITLHPRPEEG